MADKQPPTLASLGDDPTSEDLYKIVQAHDIAGRSKIKDDPAAMKAAILEAESAASGDDKGDGKGDDKGDAKTAASGDDKGDGTPEGEKPPETKADADGTASGPAPPPEAEKETQSAKRERLKKEAAEDDETKAKTKPKKKAAPKKKAPSGIPKVEARTAQASGDAAPAPDAPLNQAIPDSQRGRPDGVVSLSRSNDPRAPHVQIADGAEEEGLRVSLVSDAVAAPSFVFVSEGSMCQVMTGQATLLTMQQARDCLSAADANGIPRDAILFTRDGSPVDVEDADEDETGDE